MGKHTDLRTELQKEFSKFDSGNTGKIGTTELEELLKKLSPNLKREELELIFSKLKVEDGKVRFSEFIDLFAGTVKKEPVNPGLAKAPTDEEMVVIKEAFKKYDKDGSNQIDLKELKGMCEDLGKKLTDDQATSAMQQLDKDGNMKCNFDEFLSWYTTTPEAGGYNHVALTFMKAKLTMENGIRKIKKRAKKAIENIDDFTLKGSLDCSPDVSNPSKEKCSATLMMKKAEAPTNATSTVSLNMTCTDADKAAAINKLFEAIVADPEVNRHITAKVSTKQEENKISFVIEAPSEMMVEMSADDDFMKAMSFLQDCMKKLEGKFSLGVNVQEMLKLPDRPMLLHFQGAKLSADCIIGLSALVNFMAKDDMPPEVKAALKILAVFMQEMKICFNEYNLLTVAQKMREMFKEKEYRYSSELQMMQLAMGSLSDLRTFMWQQAVEIEAISGYGSGYGTWHRQVYYGDDDADVKRLERLWSFIREAGPGITSIDSLVLEGIPGSTVQFIVEFDQFNPFPLVDYLVGSWPKDPCASNAPSLKREQSTTEESRLKEVFAEYDKDKSGNIDLKELEEMIIKLGGKITKEEVTAAMQELDKNKDGTCCYEEFKSFWSSKPGLGGYSNLTLTFLKAKLKAAEKLQGAKKFLGCASGYVGGGESINADTFFKWGAEINRGNEVAEKMSSEVGITQVDKEPEGPPSLTFTVGTIPGKAPEVVEVMKGLMEPVEEMISMMGVSPKFEAKGDFVTVSCSPPEGMLEMLYEQEDVMKALVPLIKAMKTSNMKMVMGNDFQDFVENPDKPIAELVEGSKFHFEVLCTEKGKRLVLDAMPGKDKKGTLIAQELVKLFAGVEMSSVMCYHSKAVVDAYKLNDFAMQASTPEGIRQMIASMVPFEMLPVDDIAPYVQSVEKVLNNLESIEGLELVNIDLPARYDSDKRPSTLGFFIKGTNLKPFRLYKFIAEPTLKRFYEVAGLEA